MNVVMSKIERNRKALADFCRQNHIRRLALFGSGLRDDFSSHSDIDLLAVFDPDHIPGLEFFAMQDELSALLEHTVDLNTPQFLSPFFRDQVLAEAEVVYE